MKFLTDTEIREELTFLYKEYENKIISQDEIMNYVRDVYYIDSTGKSYEEWLKEKTNV